ncbi:sigma-E factor negative regulatory protein [Aeromonas cavernicola]|uniref:Anti-sigma-E factor RseA n=1 Tax=Aeromonas cavernicola TaxID=1006623 RepID=A0A2H9U6Q2_9GAMM|nr:RseA family anti-sigma factor [Aeromonas cavernicola]PJG59659.1 transcriptional regulator [Aeromonas cavernicola]
MANKEQLSALIDGELSDMLADELAQDANLQETWGRYHLIGDVMRGEVPSHLPLDFSDSIMARLADEPALLAPSAMSKPALPASDAQQHEIANPAPQGRHNVVPLFRRVAQQLGQYAIAASVAAAVIFGVQFYQGQDGLPANPVLNTIPVGGSATPVSVHYPQDRSRAGQQELTEQQMQEQRERVNAFLRDHQLQQRLLQDKQAQE